MKNIPLTLLATTVLSAAALQAYAATPKEPEIYFYPSKSWVVGHADVPTDCAVQSEFNNGFVLQFDGSKDWIKSFTVNFRQNIFTEGQTYKVRVSVPGKASKAMTATATGPMMLTVPLQGEKELYQAARDSAVIDFAMDDNNFRFFLVNFAPAARKFEVCMAGGDMNAVPEAAPEAPKPAPVREVSNAIPQGDVAPPPPNGASDNIETTETIHEAMALEQGEKENGTVPITEILPENPKPSVQRLPYTETVKLGDEVIAKDGVQKEGPPEAPYRKRMSEELAEEMTANPSIAAIDTTAPEAAAPAKEAVSAVPLPEPVASSMPVAAPAPAMAGKPQITPEQARAMAAAQMAGQPVAIAKSSSTTEQQPVERAELVPPPPMPETQTSNEPFAGHGDVIKTDKNPPAAMASPPPVTPAPAPVPAVPVQQAKPQHYESPPMEVHKEVHKMTADFTGAGDDSAENEPFARRKADPEMLMKISDLEKKVNELQKENSMLNSELQGNFSSAQQERTSIETENWNLERATMRYNEAERQIKRLGEQIQRERMLCQGEKKDIEAQLFDPQITSQQQMARLAELEQKLAAAQQQLEDQRQRYEERIRILQSQSATQ